MPSIVDQPERSADSGFFMMAIDPAALGPLGNFTDAMRRYVENLESSPPRVAGDPPRYPGRREGAVWIERMQDGIPIPADAMDGLDRLAASL